MPQMRGKTVINKFFKLIDPDRQIWKCICAMQRKKCGNSYINIVTHVRNARAESYDALLRDVLSSNKITQASSTEFKAKISYSIETQNVHE